MNADFTSTPAPTSTSQMPELNALAEQIGDFIHYWGFKRVHGHIWTHLFLAETPLDAADLVRQLQISKALVSISLRELLDYDVIQEVGKSPRGTNLYRTNPDILSVIMAVLRGREKRMLARMQSAREDLARVGADERKTAGISQRHLDQLSGLIERATNGLDALLALGAVDFGDWRKDFITVDLQEEESLRKASVVAPPAPRARLSAVKPVEDEADEPTSVERISQLAQKTCSSEADCPPIILPNGSQRF